MKPLNLPGRPSQGAPIEQQVKWIMDAIQAIERASQVDALTISQAYTVAHVPAGGTRILDVSTATASDVAKVVASLLVDLQKRGSQSGIG